MPALTLASGEMGLETDTGKLKIGDGSTQWPTLPYITVGGPVSGSLIPAADKTYDLGAPGSSFRHIYVAGSTIFLGSATLTSDVDGNVVFANASGQSTFVSQPLSTFTNLVTSSFAFSSIRGQDDNHYVVLQEPFYLEPDYDVWGFISTVIFTPQLFTEYLFTSTLSALPSQQPVISLQASLIPDQDNTYAIGQPDLALSDIYSYNIETLSLNVSSINGLPPGSGGSNILTENFMVAGGVGPYSLIYTYDGINWHAAENYGSSILNTCSGIAYNGSLWVAIGTGNEHSIIYSSDGIKWNPTANGDSKLTYGKYGIATNGSLWIMGGNGGYNSMAYSYDGNNWSFFPTTANRFNQTCLAVAWNGYMWVAGGPTTGNPLNAPATGTNPLIYSYDGFNWFPSANPTLFGSNGQCNAVASNGKIWVAGGTSGSSRNLAYSYDGINWNATMVATGGAALDTQCTAVAWNGIQWVAVGDGSSPIATSFDGINWTWPSVGSLMGFAKSVAWNGSYWIVGGIQNNQMIYSVDGVDWTPSPSGNSHLTGSCTAIASRHPPIPTPQTAAPGTLAGNMNMTGGGLVTWSSDSISWTEDITLVTNSANASTTQGTLFKIAPITVYMTALDSLYYAPSVGSSDVYNTGSLHIINGHDNHHEVIGDNWFLIANTSADNVIVKWNPANISIPQDATYNAATAQPSWISGGGGGGAAGPQGAIQYKDLGSFAGNSNLTYNGTVLVAKQISVSTLTNVSTINGVPYTPGGGSNALSENFSVVADIDGRMAYTYDGTSWNLGTSPLVNYGYTTIAWNGSYWMAAGSSTNIITSSDGINWTVAATNPFGISNVSGIAWNGSLWVAVGGIDTGVTGIATSPDGIIWTKSINDPLSGKSKNAVAWNGSYWVVVGGSGSNGFTIATSYDGMNWTPRSSPFDSGSPSGVAWNGTVWVVVGGNSTGGPLLVFSYDGKTWSPATVQGTVTAALSSVAWNGQIWVALINGIPTIIRSRDGQTWDSPQRITSLTSISNISWNGTVWVATGDPTIATSPDAITWTRQNTPASLAYGIFVTSRRVLPFSSNLSVDTLKTNNITTSTINGVPFSATSSANVVSENFTVAGDDSGGMAYSYDGLTWTATASKVGSCYGQAWNGSYWVAVGDATRNGSPIATSSDGINWMKVSASDMTSGSAVAWNGIYWIVVGAGLQRGINRSSNGIDWIIADNDPFNSGVKNSVAWNGSYWVVVGAGNNTPSIATSRDGKNWAGQTSLYTSVHSVAWNGSFWIAVGRGAANTIAKSTDGIVWTGISTGLDSGLGSAVAWNGNMWLAGSADKATLVSSRDADTWTSITGPFTGVNSITWNGSHWIIAGNTGFATSPDGTLWTVLSTPLSLAGRSVGSRRVLPISNNQSVDTLYTNVITTSTINGLSYSTATPGTLAGNMSMIGGGTVSWFDNEIYWTKSISLLTNAANASTTKGTVFNIAPSTIQMAAMDSLYYAPPLGSIDLFDGGSFRKINGLSTMHENIADNWFLIANTSADGNILKWNPGNICMPPTTTYDSVTATPSWLAPVPPSITWAGPLEVGRDSTDIINNIKGGYPQIIAAGIDTDLYVGTYTPLQGDTITIWNTGNTAITIYTGSGPGTPFFVVPAFSSAGGFNCGTVGTYDTVIGSYVYQPPTAVKQKLPGDDDVETPRQPPIFS